LNAVSAIHLDALSTLNFNVIEICEKMESERQYEHYLWLVLMHMFHRLELVKEFNIPEQNLYRYLELINLI
jgi:hypothetical protein